MLQKSLLQALTMVAVSVQTEGKDFTNGSKNAHLLKNAESQTMVAPKANHRAGSGYLFLLLILLFLSSCVHKDFCYDHDSHSFRYSTLILPTFEQEWQLPYEGQTDWANQWADDFPVSYTELLPGLPEGLRVVTYNAAGKMQRTNIANEGEEVYFSPGHNSLLIYNNDTQDIVFQGLETFATASVTTRTRTRVTYRGNPLYEQARSDEEEFTVSMPDMLYGYYDADHVQEAITTPPTKRVTMHPLVFKYLIKYEFDHGLKYVALARGTMAGMARGVSLCDGRTTRDAATLLYDCTVAPQCVYAVVYSFGVPDFPNPDYTRSEPNAALNLEVMLHNGKILNFYHDISAEIRRQPHGGVITIGGIHVSDEDAAAGDESGAFNVDVDDWGEFQDVEITL